MATSLQAQKQKQLSMKVTLMMCFNQSILQLKYIKYTKIFRKKIQAGLLIQSLIIL